MLNINKSSIKKIRKNLINVNIFNKYLLEDIFVSYLKNIILTLILKIILLFRRGWKKFSVLIQLRKKIRTYLNYLGIQ